MQKVEVSKLAESELLGLALKNHPSATAEVIDRHKGMVFNLALRMLSNYEDAEEASQDTFIKAFKALHTFRYDCQFSTWLFRICYNTCITQKRRSQKGIQKVSITNANAGEYQASNGETDDRKECLIQAMGELSKEDAAIVSLFYFDELPTTKISEISGISEVNVRVKLHRSRKFLKDKLHHLLKQETFNA